MAAHQQSFNWLVGVHKELLKVAEVAEILRYDHSTIYNMVLDGSLEAHRRNVERSSLRITRRSVIAWLAKSAQYEPSDFVGTVGELALRLPAPERNKLLEQLISARSRA